MTVAKAITKNVRVSPRKARLAIDLIRGLPVMEAILQLTHCHLKAGQLIKKTLISAIANAENNNGADIDELKVSAIMVDQGPVLKRISPRAKGRADRILKRTSHITVRVSDDQQ